MNLIFLDTETTCLDKARIIQLAFKKRGDTDIFMEYYKPPIAIDFNAMATHHITEKMVADKVPFSETNIYKELPSLLKDSILIAHNAKFDITVLKNEGIETPSHICTYKVAYSMYEYPNHKMQYLRYRWGIDIDEALAHDAKGDVLVLEKVFEQMLKEYIETNNVSEEAALKHFINLSTQPTLLKKLTFGKHIGKTFEEIKAQDMGYLEWLGTLKDKDADFQFTVNHHLNSTPF